MNADGAAQRMRWRQHFAHVDEGEQLQIERQEAPDDVGRRRRDEAGAALGLRRALR